MLCCVLATLGGSLLPPVPITAADASTAAADCNRLTSVINPGFVVEPTSSSDLWTCRSCASLVEQPDAQGCGEDAGANEQRTRVPDGQVATRVYDDGVDPSRRDYCTNTVPGGWECLVCTTGQTRGALRPPPTAVVHVSSNCSHLVVHTDENPAVGLVELGSPLLTVHGHGGYVMVPAMPAPMTITDWRLMPPWTTDRYRSRSSRFAWSFELRPRIVPAIGRSGSKARSKRPRHQSRPPIEFASEPSRA